MLFSQFLDYVKNIPKSKRNNEKNLKCTKIIEYYLSLMEIYRVSRTYVYKFVCVFLDQK